MMKICQHQHKGKQHTREKSQDAATSMKDAVTNTVHTSEIETSQIFPEKPSEFHAQEAAECLKE
jgi:hypothetical protein